MFSPKDIELLKNFGKNRDIIVCKTDKGRGVVVMNKTDYISSMTKIITNSSKFVQIEDEIKKVVRSTENKINKFLGELKKQFHISDSLYQKLRSTGAAPGILYGLPKIHKPDFATKFQCRPIFAAYSCAAYNLSKYLVSILNPLANNDFTVENSKSFIQKLSSISNSENLIMASFDIQDLYTNVPLVETIDICINELNDGNGSIFNMPAQIFRRMLELSVFNSIFMFNSRYYKQVDGFGMGLPLSPTNSGKHIFMPSGTKMDK